MNCQLSSLVTAFFLATLCCPSWSQILIGQTSGFTGPSSDGVLENTEGARLYFDHVNARGGINGQLIELISMDDKNDPKTAADNARQLITHKNVISLFLSRGTPHTQAMMPILTQHQVPLVAPASGAMVLHRPAHPWVFNVRATYQREAEKAIQHLATIGVNRIAVVRFDDPFGEDCMEGLNRGFEITQLQPIFVEKIDRVKPDLSVPVARAQAHKPQAIVFIGAAAFLADFLRTLRERDVTAQLVTLSNNASSGFIKLLGEHGRGTVVTQVFPYERSIRTPFVKEVQTLAAARGITDVSPAMLEGYAGAKVLVAALQRAGPKPTRASLHDALNKMQHIDIGGLDITYSPNDHTGLDFADLSIIDRDGRFIR